MAGLSALIEGCAYSPGGQNMGFSHDGMPVLLEPRRMTVFGAPDEARARRVADWLAALISLTEGNGCHGQEAKHERQPGR